MQPTQVTTSQMTPMLLLFGLASGWAPNRAPAAASQSLRVAPVVEMHVAQAATPVEDGEPTVAWLVDALDSMGVPRPARGTLRLEVVSNPEDVIKSTLAVALQQAAERRLEFLKQLEQRKKAPPEGAIDRETLELMVSRSRRAVCRDCSSGD